MIVRVVLGIITVAFIAGCGSGVRFVRMDETKYPARPKNASVDTFPQSTLKPHVVIGTMRTEKGMDVGSGDRSIYDDAVDALKSYARRVGADALLHLQPKHVGEGSGGKVVVEATAVRYLEPSQTVTSEQTGSTTP